MAKLNYRQFTLLNVVAKKSKYAHELYYNYLLQLSRTLNTNDYRELEDLKNTAYDLAKVFYNIYKIINKIISEEVDSDG